MAILHKDKRNITKATEKSDFLARNKKMMDHVRTRKSVNSIKR